MIIQDQRWPAFWKMCHQWTQHPVIGFGPRTGGDTSGGYVAPAPQLFGYLPFPFTCCALMELFDYKKGGCSRFPDQSLIYSLASRSLPDSAGPSPAPQALSACLPPPPVPLCPRTPVALSASCDILLPLQPCAWLAHVTWLPVTPL